MKLRNLAFASLLCASTAFANPVQQLIQNGSFETGNLSGWTTSGIIGSSVCGSGSNGTDWHVGNAGNATNCSVVANPIDGHYAAYNMLDSGTANTTYWLAQSFVVPDHVDTAKLKWSDSYVSNYNGNDRLFTIGLYNGATLVGNLYTEHISHRDGDSNWQAHNVQLGELLAANAGQSLTLKFAEFIPDRWSGPAGFGLDLITLDASINVPEPASVTLVGLGLAGVLLARRRKQRA